MNTNDYFTLLAQRCVARCLKDLCIDSTDPQVVDLLGQLLALTICNAAATCQQWASQVNRAKFNILDLYITMKCVGCSSLDLARFTDHQTSAPALSLSSSEPEPSAVKSAKCIKLESNYRSKYFYDFLPALPSVHTYKRTVSRIVPSVDKAFVAYRKSDERRLMEKNLKNMFKAASSVSMQYLNYEL